MHIRVNKLNSSHIRIRLSKTKIMVAQHFLGGLVVSAERSPAFNLDLATRVRPRTDTLLAADPSDGSVGPSELASDYFPPPPPCLLSVICLQLRDADLAVLISLCGIIAVMIGFAGNTDRRVETSGVSDWELLESRAKARRVCLARPAQSSPLITSVSFRPPPP